MRNSQIAKAVRHHRAGRSRQAAALYENILRAEPGHADALHLAGVLALEQGEFSRGTKLLVRAIQANPNVPAYYLNLGTAFLRAGQGQPALLALSEALTLEPALADGWQKLARAFELVGQLEDAISSYRRAVEIQPDDIHLRLELARILARSGQLDRAAETARRAAERDGRDVAGWDALGDICLAANRCEEAAEAFTKASLLAPQAGPLALKLGNARHLGGRMKEAAAAYERACCLDPQCAEAHHNLGVTQMLLGQLEAATASFERAVALSPGYAEAHNNLGNVLHVRGSVDAAIAAYQAALRARPDYTDARYNLGLAFQETSRLPEALSCYEEVVRQRPDFLDAENNRGNALRDLGRLEDAVASYQAVLKRSPEHPQARWNLGLADLLAGRMLQGWAGYEWRFRQPGSAPPDRGRPLWDGSALEGRSILLHAEQGLGDTLQFVRFAPLVQARGGRVLFECPPDAARLLADTPGIDELFAAGSPLPPFDVHLPLMSAPDRLQVDIDRVRMARPYVRPAVEAVRQWQRRVPPPAEGFLRVGLCWSGNPLHKWNARRSVPLEHMRALTACSQVKFISLQHAGNLAGARRAGGRVYAGALELLDYEEHVRDLADRAALIFNLDLVITVDTSIAHLAGASGCPVWTLLAFAPDWRWMLNRDDSPWYPTMRLFRQQQAGDWASVMGRIRAELDDLVQASI